MSSENTVGKGEIAHNEQSLPFPQCFLPFWRTFCHFHETKDCRLPTLSIKKSLEFFVWETVKVLTNISQLEHYMLLLYPCKINVFWGILESVRLSVCVSAYQCVYLCVFGNNRPGASNSKQVYE